MWGSTMKVKIRSGVTSCRGWYMRDYLQGRTCEVLAEIVTPRGQGNFTIEYFVLHPVTKKPGYYLPRQYCEVVEQEVQTFDEFLNDNDYGYSKN